MICLWRWLRGLFRRRRPAKESAALPPRRIDPPPRPPKRPAPARRLLRQVPATAADIERLGKLAAVEIARVENAKRLQRATVRASDGELYVRWPGGPWMKTSGKAVMLPDGTLRALPPDPRPTKRERARARRRLKREERK